MAMMTRGMVSGWSLVAVGVLFAGGCAPQGLAGQAHDISAVTFLSGCWAGTMGSLDMREQWSEADGGVMLGTTRFFRDGVLADFEFGMIVEEDGQAVLWPYPRGERSEHGFPLERIEGAEYVFENLEHDFPVRIIYVREGTDRLAPRIEGPDGEGPGWRLERTTCPG